MRHTSARRKAEEVQRDGVIVQAFARDGHACRARTLVPEVRCRMPLDPHEIIPRSAWRDGYLVLDNVIVVCRGHHDWIDANPNAAHEVGLHGYSWERPE